MKLLHLDSSALDQFSVSRELSALIVQQWKRRHPGIQVTYRDLAANPLPHWQPVVDASRDPNDLGQAVFDEFIAADVIVIGAPMYNFGISTQLKAWIDRIAVAGQTFRYTEAGPEGLCGGKKVVIVSTSGGMHAGQATGVAHEEYLKLLFGFIGITDIEIVRAEGLAYGDDVRSKAMSAAHAQISEQLFAAA